MSENEEIELSPLQRIVGNVVAGCFIILCGLFLLLVGVKVIPLELKDLVLPSILLAIGLTLLLTACIQRNSVSLWISFVFNVPAAVLLLSSYTVLTQAMLYPFYIAVPAIASLFTMLLSGFNKDHLYVIGFFGLTAFLFILNSLIGVSWAIVIPLIIVYVGLIIIYFAVRAYGADKKGKD